MQGYARRPTSWGLRQSLPTSHRLGSSLWWLSESGSLQAGSRCAAERRIGMCLWGRPSLVLSVPACFSAAVPVQDTLLVTHTPGLRAKLATAVNQWLCREGGG